ncbi:unnamed protein product [Auanema sp. JU1783]|nr:unnamed protein product [Auanema sp. JU1783]
MKLLLTIILCILLFKYQVVDAISCLVIRPGYGLVPEKCSQTAVGCRIRVSGDHIEWYEWAKLYDRNQLVCVYPGEYDTVTGCQRKPSGSVRCWCGAKDNCNEAETSKNLYEAFTTSDKKRMASIVKDLEDNASPAEDPTTTTTTRKVVKPTSSSKLHRVTMRNKVHHRPPTTTATEPQTTTRAKYHELPRKPTRLPVDEMYDDDEEDDANEEDDDRILTNEEPRPLPTESAFGFDDTFEETRKKLEKEMKEEDERLKELLQDEERELEDEDEVPTRQAKSFSLNAKKSRLSASERRDRGRGSEERRNQDEEERLAEIEREEAAEKMKKLIEHSRQREQERQEDDDDDDSDEEEEEDIKTAEEEAEAAGFGFTKTASSYASWCSLLISMIVARQVLSSNVI